MDVPEVAAWVQTMWDIGRRPGDLHGLMVLDDLTRRRLDRGEIRSGLYYDPRAQAVRGWQQKTGSFGSIGLDPLTVELIEAVRPRVEDGSNHRHVFIDSRFCEPFTFERFNPQFRLVIRAMDEDVALTKTTPQSGRHSCIMRFRRAGHSHADIQEVTGHYDEKTIARFYVVEDDSRVDALKAARAASEGNGD
jgi:integrase